MLRFVAALVLPLFLAGSHGFAGEGRERPRLVVLVVFDQLRGDYPQRWAKQFGEGGFKRLQEEGAWFSNCRYPYANTITAAGHASMATGCSPNKHGIIANTWYDRDSKRLVTSVGSEKHRQLPEPEPLPKEALGVSPWLRLQPSVADALREATRGRSRIVSLSLKPRSASLLAALMEALVLWFSDHTGGFVTSTYYRDALPDWVEAFNREQMAASWFGKEWDRFRPALDYDKLAGPDDLVGESRSLELGRTFPHRVTGGLDKPGERYFEAMMATPFGNDLLAALAKRAIEAEKLGQDEVPDLLLLSFSSNDIVGHLFGPDSHEVLDMTLRTDALMADFLRHLDAKVGKGRYGVVVCSDHGVCPIPEVVERAGKKAGRIHPGKLAEAAEDYLQVRFGPSERPYIEAMYDPNIYLDARTLAMRKVSQKKAENALAAWAASQPGIQAAFTRNALLAGMPKDELGASVWRSFHPDRSGDVYLVARPHYLVTTYASGTSHGSPHDYDTHVPLFVLGPGVAPGIHDEATTPQACAAILARLLGIDPPRGAEAPLPNALAK